MTGYVIRRLIGAAAVVGLLTLIIFLILRSMPGDALMVKLGETGRLSDAQMEQLRDEMGLDDPLPVQYGAWVLGLVRFDFGDSMIYDDRPVRESVFKALPVTMQLAFLSLLIGLTIGLSLGTLSAVYRNGIIDNVARVVGIFGLSVPVFWLALVIILYGALWFGLGITRPYVFFWDDPLANLALHIVPASILGLNLGAVVMRYTRSAMLEVLRQDYMRTATAKGLQGRRVILRHGLRNAFIPIITLIGTQAAFLLSGSVVIEVIFRYPGLGRLTYEAILTRDYTVVQGATLVIGVLVVSINLIVDLAYGVLDPRVRYG